MIILADKYLSADDMQGTGLYSWATLLFLEFSGMMETFYISIVQYGSH